MSHSSSLFHNDAMKQLTTFPRYDKVFDIATALTEEFGKKLGRPACGIDLYSLMRELLIVLGTSEGDLPPAYENLDDGGKLEIQYGMVSSFAREIVKLLNLAGWEKNGQLTEKEVRGLRAFFSLREGECE